MASNNVVVEVKLPADTCRALARIAAMAGVPPEDVIKVALAARVAAESPLTPWFASWAKPDLPGVYQRARLHSIQSGEIGYSFWDGKSWGLISRTPVLAVKRRRLTSMFLDAYWRGLAEDPAGKTL